MPSTKNFSANRSRGSGTHFTLPSHVDLGGQLEQRVRIAVSDRKEDEMDFADRILTVGPERVAQGVYNCDQMLNAVLAPSFKVSSAANAFIK
jgi:hypothetical protein